MDRSPGTLREPSLPAILALSKIGAVRESRRSRPSARPPEVLAEREGLVLVGRPETNPIQPFGPSPETLEGDSEQRLTVVDDEGNLPGSDLHDDLGAEQGAIAVSESRI